MLAFIVAALISQAALAGTLTIEQGRVRESIPGQDRGVAYLVVRNSGAEACTLEAVASPRAGKVEIHEHRHSGGKMQMRKVDSLSIPARGQRVFTTGGYHLMLFDLETPLRRGQEVAFDFDFGGCGKASANMTVKALSEM